MADRVILNIMQLTPDISLDWSVGQVILDLYEVRPIQEGAPRHYAEGEIWRVYRVHHRGWNKDLAMMVPLVSAFESQLQKENVTRECETWVNLGLHPHTVSCHYVRRVGDVPMVLAEFMEGGSLKAWIDCRKLYVGGPEESLRRILDIAIQFAWGLQYAHDQGLLHQDVKPANVMMTAEGIAKVKGFGRVKARSVMGETAGVRGGQCILASYGGKTLAYCSPEQAQIAGLQKANADPARLPNLTHKTDIWSWALSVLEMFVGRPFWVDYNPGGLAGLLEPQALESYMRGEVENAAVNQMPDVIADCLRRCLRLESKDRPGNLREVVGELIALYRKCAQGEYGRSEPKAVKMDASSLNNRGLSLMDLGQADQALAVWDEALAKHPGHWETTYNWAIRLWRRGSLTDQSVVEALREAKSRQPGDWSAAYHLGLVHLARGDGESAKEVLDEAVRLGGDGEAEVALDCAHELSLEGGRCLRTFAGHTSVVSSVCLSGNGRLALSGSWDHTLGLWEISTGRHVRTFEGHKNFVDSVCLSGDGRWALSGSWDQTLRLWEVSSGRCVRTFEGHAHTVNSVCLSGDGHWALSGSFDHTVRLWDISSGHCVRTFKGHTDNVHAVCLSGDGHWALSGSEDKTLRLWEVSSGRCVRTFEGHMGGVRSVCLSGDGCWALSGSEDNTLRLWDVASGRCVWTFEGHAGEVDTVCLSGDSRWAVSGSFDQTIRLWEISSGRCVRTFEGHAEGVRSVCLSGDGCCVLSGSWDNTLRLWEVTAITTAAALQPPALLCSVRSAEEHLRTQARFADLIASAQQALEMGRSAEALRLAREARSLASCEIAPDALVVWNAVGLKGVRRGFRAGWCRRMFEGNTIFVDSVCLSRDGCWALSGSEQYEGVDHTLSLWEVSSGRCVRTFEGHTDSVCSVCLSGDGRWALSGSWDKTLRLWEVASGRCVRTFEGHTDSVCSVCLSGDGRWALSGSLDKTLRLWEVHSGRCVRTFEGHTGSVYSVCLSCDGRWALSGSCDHTLRLWEVASGSCVRTFEGHTGSVYSVCLSDDGSWALSGCHDKTLRLWEISSGRCVRTFEGHRHPVSSVCLSSDGCWALSGSHMTLGLWELDWELEAHDSADWHEGARPYLLNFLTLHTPPGGHWPNSRTLTEEEVQTTLTRSGRPLWNEEDFRQLMHTLACSGYGWLRPEGLRRELEKTAANWQGPPPLPQGQMP